MTQVVSSLHCGVQRIRAAAWLVGAVALLLWSAKAEALQANQTDASQEQRVANDMEMIHAGERAGMEPLKLGRLWAHLAMDYADAGGFLKSEDAFNHALKLYQSAPDGNTDYAIALDDLGWLYLTNGDLNAAERCRKRAMTLREAMGDKLQVTRGESHLAEVSLAQRHFKEATQEASQAYDEMVALKDPDASDLVATLITLVYANCMSRHSSEGVTYGREATSLARASFAASSLPTGQARMALGYAEWKAGLKNEADEDMREGIAILREQKPPGRPDVLVAMRQYRTYLDEMHRKREAQQIAEEEKRIESASQASCANCTVSVNALRPK